MITNNKWNKLFLEGKFSKYSSFTFHQLLMMIPFNFRIPYVNSIFYLIGKHLVETQQYNIYELNFHAGQTLAQCFISWCLITTWLPHSHDSLLILSLNIRATRELRKHLFLSNRLKQYISVFPLASVREDVFGISANISGTFLFYFTLNCYLYERRSIENKLCFINYCVCVNTKCE